MRGNRSPEDRAAPLSLDLADTRLSVRVLGEEELTGQVTPIVLYWTLAGSDSDAGDSKVTMVSLITASPVITARAFPVAPT